MQTTCLDLCIFSAILLFESFGVAAATDYHYSACVPTNCGDGPNITFPFYIPGLQESFCGFPGFGVINCSLQGFPVLQFPGNGNEYVVQDIFYQTRTLRVYNEVVSRQYSNGCFPGPRNLTDLPTGGQFGFADNVTELYMFSRCNGSIHVDRDRAGGCDLEGGEKWDLVVSGKDGNFSRAMENCERKVVVPVEEAADDDGGVGTGDLEQVLRKGFVLNWTASGCNECEASGGRCGFNVSSYHFRCFCPDRPRARRCRPGDSNAKLITATVVTGGGVFLLTCLFSFVIWHCKRIKNLYYLFSRNMLSKPDMESTSESSYFGIPLFSYTELQLATNNFDPSNELGDGGFGTVYHGKLRDGREVAVKRLYKHNDRRMEQFMNEIKVLTCLRHSNLISLYGCTSQTSKELLLVFEYVPNGSLSKHLHGSLAASFPLTWSIRLNIAVQTASALSYLHNSDVVHRDIKTDNILLDRNFCVKVADFGLSRLFPNDATHVSTCPQGTLGYVDPEYYQSCRLTDKSDVYSFGVVLIELVSSLPAVDVNRHGHEVNLANMAVNKIQNRVFDELIDKALGYDDDADVARMTTAVAELAFLCLQADKDVRPSMDEVLDALKEIQSGGDNVIKGVTASSPEVDDVALCKSRDFQTSSSLPDAVNDFWRSTSAVRN